MSPEEFRRLALALPGAIESAHMRHPDFRVGKRIFATLGYPSDEWAMVKLPPDQQARVVAERPDVFTPANGAWGLQGSTRIRLDIADVASVADALGRAWQRAAETSKPVAPRPSQPAPKAQSPRPRARKGAKAAAPRRTTSR